MAKITGTKTIAQFKIAQWVNDNFEENSVLINYLTDDTATITDRNNNILLVRYDNDTGNIITSES